MDKLSKLEERATINFPRLLNASEMRDFLEYLYTKLSSETKESYTSMNGRREDYWTIYPSEEGTHTFDIYPKEITGSVSSRGTYVNFRMSRHDFYSHDLDTFDFMKFNTIPGYNLEEHNPKEIELMDTIRKYTEEYFSEKS